MHYLICCLLFIIFPAFGDDVIELRARLHHVSGFYANFVQKIIDSSGSILQENSGELWVQHPCFFNYHIIFPEEYFVISNGETLWFYDPSINQVIVNWFKDVIKNSVFMLLVDRIGLNWENYYVDKNEDDFFIVPKDTQNIPFKNFKIKITNQGIIKNFSVLNIDNQYIDYQLTKHDIRIFDAHKFVFSPPPDVEIDEQRK